MFQISSFLSWLSPLQWLSLIIWVILWYFRIFDLLLDLFWNCGFIAYYQWTLLTSFNNLASLPLESFMLNSESIFDSSFHQIKLRSLFLILPVLTDESFFISYFLLIKFLFLPHFPKNLSDRSVMIYKKNTLRSSQYRLSFSLLFFP